MPSLPPITTEQLGFIEHAQDLTFELAGANADDIREFVRYLDLASLLGGIRAGQSYPEFAPSLDKAVEALRSAADAIEQDYSAQSMTPEVLRVIADRWATLDEARDDEPAIALGELAGRAVFVGDSVGTDFPAKIVLDEQVVMELPHWVIVYVDQPRWNTGEPGKRVFLDVGGAEAELTHTEGVRVCNALVAALNEVGESR